MKDELETSLHTALAAPDPGEDFTARVMARLPDSTVVPLPAARKRSAFSSAWLPGALAAAVVLGLALQQQDRRAESAAALQAKSQLLVALRITGEQLDRTTHRLQESNP